MANPIIQRELVGILRTRWSLTVQIICPAIFPLLVLLQWPTDQQIDLAGVRAQQVFRLFGYGLLAVLLLLVPAHPATTFVRDRLRGTLALLLHTPLSGWSIYVGKLVGTLGFGTLLLVLSLPAVAACYTLGSLSVVSDVAPLYAILLAVIVQYAALALWVSSFAGSIDSALRITYGLVLLLAFLTLVPYQFVQGQPDGWKVTIATWMRSSSPVAAVMELHGHGDVGGQGLIAGTGTVARYLILALLSTIVFAAHTIWRLKPTFQDRPRGSGVITDERTHSAQRLRRLLLVSDPQRRTKPISSYTNPIMVKEFRSRKFGRSHWMMRMVSLCALASLALTYFTATGSMTWGVETIGSLMVFLQAALIVLLAPALAAGLISAERESGSWALLLMTPLPAHRIVLGKLISVAWPAALLLLATLPGYAVMMYIQPVLQPQILRVLTTLILGTAMAIMLSAAISSLMARTATATMVAYGVVGAMWGGTLLVWLGRGRPFGHSVVETVLTASPIAAALSLIELPGFADYKLTPGNWYLSTLGCVVAAMVLGIRTRRLMRPMLIAMGVGMIWLCSKPTPIVAVEIDSAMLIDPALESVQETAVFSPKLKPLWLAALERPESDLKRQAAEAIAKAARLGMPDLDDFVDPLLRELAVDKIHPLVRLAVARALIQLNAHKASAALASRAQSDGLDVAQLVEPALARWDYRPHRDVWLARLESSDSSQRRLMLAIRALRQVREPLAAGRLRQLAMDQSQRADVRLESAQAAAMIGSDDFTALANQLLSTPHDRQVTNRLVAAQLLTGDTSTQAHLVLRELAIDPEPAVASIALKIILNVDPHLVADVTDQLANSGDTNVRSVTVELLRSQQTPAAVDLLASLLADPHPALRTKACDALVSLATVEQLARQVRQVVTRTLESPQPAAVQQAALAVGALRHLPAAERLVSLLDAPESDVNLAAAWALRQLADPTIAPAIMDKIGRETKRRLELIKQLAPIVAANPYVVPDYPPIDASNSQLEQLIQALALMRYKDAEPLLRTFLPKPPRPQLGEPPVLETEKQVVLRAAANWGLGVYHGDNASDQLRQALRERLGDTHPKHPEHPLVRRMSAISLARMHDRPAVDMMRELCEPPKAYTELGRACRWAMYEITGEAPPDLPAIPRSKTDWFLVPFDPEGIKR